MKKQNYEIYAAQAGTENERREAYKNIYEYILKRYCEVYYNAEGSSLSESFNRGTGREGIFDASTAGGMHKESI
ncbi:MAG: hypothetical protein ACM3TR_07820 [Caulobacteraceae bacterium]